MALPVALRHRLLDVGLAAVLLALSLADLFRGVLDDVYPQSVWAHLPFVVAVALPLVWRRTYPLTAFIVFAVLQTTWIALLFPVDVQPPLVVFLQLLVMVYSVGAYTAGRAVWAAGAVVAVGLLADIPTVVAGRPWGELAGPDVLLLVAYTFGLLVAGLRRQAVEHQRRAERAEREQQEAAESAAAAERARIARELHDIVSHDVSLMVLQASVERQAHPDDSTAATLASIEATGREALAELRRMLGVLRADGEGAPLAPQPGVAQLPDLVENARAAGLPVRLVVAGRPVPIPPGLDIAAYRIVQEALTNAAKHAAGADVTATVCYGDRDLAIEVVDDGARTAPPALEGGGHGLVGVRERVSVLGGTFEAAPRPDGGFRLRATLPLVVA